tara:strand:+ start:1370 stop:2674 length:1305 start_codon:yes stop_codon:yes gene_type:complete
MATKNPTRLGQLIIAPQVADGATPAYSNPKTANQIDPSHGSYDGSGVAVEAEIFQPSTGRSVFTRESFKSGFFELAPISGDQHGQEFSVRFPINGWSSTVPTTSPTLTSSPAFGIFTSILGGGVALDPNGNNPGYVSSGADTDDIPYSAGSYKVGSAIGTTDGSAFSLNFVSGDAGSNLDLLVASNITPADASAIYGSVTCFDQPTGVTPFTMLWRGYTANSRLLLTSCVPTSVNVTFDPRAALMMEVTFNCNTVEQAPASGTLGEFSYSLPIISPPSGANNARLVFQNSTAGTAATDLDCEAFTMSLTQELTPAIATGATTGVRDMIVQNRTQEVTFSTLMGDKNPFDQTPDGKPFVDISNPSNVGAIQLAVGSQPGKMMGMLIPKPIMMSVPSLDDLNGVVAQSFTLRPGDFQNAGSGSGEAKASNFRVAFV